MWLGFLQTGPTAEAGSRFVGVDVARRGTSVKQATNCTSP